MASVSALSSPNILSFCRKPISKNLVLRPFEVDFPWCRARTSAIKTHSDGAGPTSNGGADLLRWPAFSDPGGDDDPADEAGEKKDGDGDTWVDWDDQILQDTVPLVAFVRTVLHSGKYGSGDRLNPQDEKTILEKLLAYHPACEKKIGCGVDYITIGYHPNFQSSRCLFIVRNDGELVDFSYWKCIKGLIRKNYPLYAESFIMRHFSPSRRRD
ncbi:Protein of unknown function (DUF3223 [Striga hermonthica]|uniref:DCL protein n=1 Tax=Striga hermonthica TaxID=68872 RepID=A0A9N7P159_STRHE|nr:Protein of unknown function (DUF3223 [Striga hermonthica]